ncbi:putative glucuronosyltransferase PGSIP8 [Silene latifolia]|uniref:putative glucuronosyltransferase PGSIP8 n=1 Tax=Silene latifolia TaxID=37657 RepID=UPI003D774CD6
MGSLRWPTVVAVMVVAMCLKRVAEGRYGEQKYKNAYATMMYMGTPRDYEYYVATRVLMRSLVKLDVKADLVVIASVDVPALWVRAMELEDGLKVVKVENVLNPYMAQDDSNRFKLTMNKLYAWNLVEYDRVVMLDADNLFLQKTDELFQCGQFCAAFINPCIFHTGLFVLQPSKETFEEMLHDLEMRRPNPDRADQGFIGGYFSDLLDMPLFHPPANATKLTGNYRLPLGYQMDASYYYLKLRWNVPCGPNSVITFPGAVWMKPWYWWSWPTLPLGFSWHEQRRNTLGYNAEIPMVLMLVVLYVGIIAITCLPRQYVPKFCYRRPDRSGFVYNTGLKLLALASIIAAYVIPFYIIPQTVHPLAGWSLYLLGSFALSSIVITTFTLPTLPVITPCLGIFGVLLVMLYPWHKDGVVRALAVFGYAFCASPFLWLSLVKVWSSLHVSEREAFMPSRLTESQPLVDFNKIT